MIVYAACQYVKRQRYKNNRADKVNMLLWFQGLHSLLILERVTICKMYIIAVDLTSQFHSAKQVSPGY